MRGRVVEVANRDFNCGQGGMGPVTCAAGARVRAGRVSFARARIEVRRVRLGKKHAGAGLREHRLQGAARVREASPWQKRRRAPGHLG